jgi:hypothetical protein
MIPWYENLWVRTTLHVVGLAILGSAYLEGFALYAAMHGHPTADASPGEFLLAGAMFLSASFGSALTIMGRRLWGPVQVSARWAQRS